MLSRITGKIMNNHKNTFTRASVIHNNPNYCNILIKKKPVGSCPYLALFSCLRVRLSCLERFFQMPLAG